MNPKEEKHNEINVNYHPDRMSRMGFNSINIEIKNTSYGALRMLTKDLQELGAKWQKQTQECWHPVTAVYYDLLFALSQKIKHEIEFMDEALSKNETNEQK